MMETGKREKELIAGIILLSSLILIAGCVSESQPLEDTTNTSFNTSEEINSSDNEKAAIPEDILKMSLNKIKEFSGIDDDTLRYERTFHTGWGDLYSFSGDSGLFTIDSSNGRVGFASYWQIESSDKDIGIEEAQIIAESYARSKYPELWNLSGNRSVKNTGKNELDHGSGDREYSFIWREIIYSPNEDSPERYEIIGLGSVGVTLSCSGEVTLYSELYNVDEPVVDLIPAISKEQAWDIARKYYEEHDVTTMPSLEEVPSVLQIWDDIGNDVGWPQYGKQYLAWSFDVEDEKSGYGGIITIDAHDGHIINYAMII